MQTERSDSGSVSVLAVSGRIDAYTAAELDRAVLGAVEAGRHLVVDLSGTDYVSSAGLRVLITAAKRADQQQLKLCLCGLQEAVREVFDIAGFTRLFVIQDSREAALAALSAT